MIKWIKKLFSNLFLRAGFLFLFMELIIAGCAIYLQSITEKKSAGVSFVLFHILVLLTAVSAILCCIAILIMIINNSIYGNKVTHNKDFWKGKDAAAAGPANPAEPAKDPYLLAVRHKNPVPGFVTGLLLFISIPVWAFSEYTDYSGFDLKQLAAVMLIIYVQVIVTVFLIRLNRRLRAFHVKKYTSSKKGI